MTAKSILPVTISISYSNSLGEHRPQPALDPGPTKHMISMNFHNLMSYDVKICSIDSYNQHSLGNGP